MATKTATKTAPQTNNTPRFIDAYDTIVLALSRAKGLFAALPHVTGKEEAIALGHMGEELCIEIQHEATRWYRNGQEQES